MDQKKHKPCQQHTSEEDSCYIELTGNRADMLRHLLSKPITVSSKLAQELKRTRK